MAKKKTQASELELVYVDPHSLKPAEKNPRIMPAREMEALKAALDHWGFVDPIVVRKEDMEIIGGHQRVTAAIDMGLTQVPIVIVDVSKVDAMILNEALNRIHGGWDEPQLALHQEEIRLAGGDLSLTGFTPAEINMLRSGRRLSGQVVEPPTPDPPETAVTQVGDVWALGDHRLVCGDAGDPVAVSKALADRPVGLLFTDPPYGVDYDPEDRASYFSDRRLATNLGGIRADSLKGEAYTDWLASILGVLPLSAGVAAYVCHASTIAEFALAAFRKAGFKLSSIVIWAKTYGVFGRADYHWQHEPLMYGWKPGVAHRWFGDHTQTTLWSIATDHAAEGVSQEEKRYGHPTQKPVALAARAIVNSSLEGDVVLDPFAGSGSAMLAAAQLGRIGALVEIDPRWCDVIVKRWELLTGQTAQRI
jgi:DNA modification methylase